MQAPFDNIVQHLFHQPSLHSVTIGELENMAQQHPYFAAAHFLLLKKMQDTDQPQFSTQLHKTTLYFNNPLWLQYLLQPETVANFTVSEKSPFLTGETTAAANTAEENESGNIAVSGETAFQQAGQHAVEEPDQNKQTSTEPSIQYSPGTSFPQAQAGIMDVITEVFNERTDPPRQAPAIEEINTIIAEEMPVQAAGEFIHPDHTEIIDGPVVENIPGEDMEATVPGETKAETAMPAEAVHEPIIEENTTGSDQPEPAETVEQNNGTINLETAEAPAPVSAFTTTEEPTMPTEAAAVTEENTALSFHEQALEPEPVAEAAGNTDADDTNPQAEEIPAAEMPEAATNNNEEKPLLKTIIETSAAKNDLLFEPYHTVDYFASQGIKLSKMELDSKE